MPVDPVHDRVALAEGSGSGGRAGIGRFRHMLRYADAEKSYDEWRRNPITQLVRGVVQELLLNSPRAGFSTDSLPVHHGMTLAFGIVAQLIDDPRLIVPGTFSAKAEDPGSPHGVPENYTTSLDDALDQEM